MPVRGGKLVLVEFLAIRRRLTLKIGPVPRSVTLLRFSFMVALGPESRNRPQAEEKAGQLLEVIKATPMDWEGKSITLSCAVGIHQFSSEQSADDALSQADASMYKEKKKHYEGKPPARSPAETKSD